jgi:beta-lactamase superfamily II metal-dependent hydrolase
MFKLHAVQAQFGDSLVLEYGTPTKPRFILIDGGPPDTYKEALHPALQDIVVSKKLDLVILSHIDNDHIIGILDFMAALEEDLANQRPPHIAIAELWHNSFQASLDADRTMTRRLQTLLSVAGGVKVAMPLAKDALFGVKEGTRLRVLAKKLHIPVNKGFPDDLIVADTAQPKRLGKLILRIVGPNQAKLRALREEWLKWLEKAEERMEFDPSMMANADQSVPNLSSIILLAECDAKTILLTGDARGDHIESGLEQAGLLVNGKLHVDVLKVAHHGSDRNATARFFKNITAGTYVISANGKYGNPDYDTLKWIIEASSSDRRPIEIVLTNETPVIKQIKKSHNPEKYGYRLIVRPKADHSIVIQLS